MKPTGSSFSVPYVPPPRKPKPSYKLTPAERAQQGRDAKTLSFIVRNKAHI